MEELASSDQLQESSNEAAVNNSDDIENVSSPTLSTNTSDGRSKEHLEICDTEDRDISSSEGKRKLSVPEIGADDSNEASSSKKSKYKNGENEISNDAADAEPSQQKDENEVSSNVPAEVECSREKDAENEANLDDAEPASSAELDSESHPNSSVSNIAKDSSIPVGNATVKIKTEPIDTDTSAHSSATTSADIKPTINIKKEEATSTSRESCRFGIRCYRRNPMHRIEEAHPGDHDYKRPIYPPPPAGSPNCPYGINCYRRNPLHFQQFTHPPQTDFEQNWKIHCYRLRQHVQRALNGTSSNNDVDAGSSSDLDDYDVEDPFHDEDNDADADFIPSDDELKNASDSFIAGESDDDECDKAEE